MAERSVQATVGVALSVAGLSLQGFCLPLSLAIVDAQAKRGMKRGVPGEFTVFEGLVCAASRGGVHGVACSLTC